MSGPANSAPVFRVACRDWLATPASECSAGTVLACSGESITQWPVYRRRLIGRSFASYCFSLTAKLPSCHLSRYNAYCPTVPAENKQYKYWTDATSSAYILRRLMWYRATSNDVRSPIWYDARLNSSAIWTGPMHVSDLSKWSRASSSASITQSLKLVTPTPFLFGRYMLRLTRVPNTLVAEGD